MIVLHGPEGIGTTAVAVEHAHLAAGAYDVVWWVNAGDRLALHRDFAQLARRLALPLSDRDDWFAVYEARKWLEQNGRWLLVLDGAGRPEELLPHLPQVKSGHVLITSSDARWTDGSPWTAPDAPAPEVPLPPVPQVIVVPPWSRLEATLHFRRRAGSDDGAAAELVAALGDVPLAVSLVAARSRATGEPALALLDEVRAMLGAGATGQALAASVRDAVVVAWHLATRSLASADADGVVALELAALHANDALTGSAEAILLGSPRAGGYEAVRGALVDRHFLAKFEEGVRLHPLVGAIALEHIEHARGRGALSDLATRALRSALIETPGNEFRWASRHGLDTFAPHQVALAGNVRRFGGALDMAATALVLVGEHFVRWNAHRVAASVFEEALAAYEALEGAEGIGTVETLRRLGRAAAKDRDSGERASAALDRAVATIVARGGPGSAIAGAVYLEVGQAMFDAHRPDAALAHLGKALAIAERLADPKQLSVAACAGAIAKVLNRQFKLAEARAFYERAIAEEQREAGEATWNMCDWLADLGRVLRGLDDQPAAAETYRRVIACATKLNPDPTIWIAEMWWHFGNALGHLEKLDEARAALERAVDLERELGMTEDVFFPQLLCDLGGIVERQGHVLRARQLYEKALSLVNRCTWNGKKDILAHVHLALGLLALHTGDTARARLHRDAASPEVGDWRTRRWREHADMAYLVGALLLDEGDTAGAKEAIEHACEIEAKLKPKRPGSHAAALAALGRVLERAGDPTAAARCREQALSIQGKALGPIP